MKILIESASKNEERIMKKPKLYRVVEIKFPSLRDFYSFAGVSEIDIMVRLRARRVLNDNGWQWQIVASEFDKFRASEADVICLNDCDLDDVLVCTNKTKRAEK